ncbi:hypothetical protein DV738_g2374, partial [Chaetothyriales sp. CBS 135597]
MFRSVSVALPLHAKQNYDDADTSADRHGRRRPFANWMKRLANLKNLHADSPQQPLNTHQPEQLGQNGQRGQGEQGGRSGHHRQHGHNNGHTGQNDTSKAKKQGVARNGPYLASGTSDAQANGDHAYFSPGVSAQSRSSSYSHSKNSLSVSHDGQTQLKSRPPTLGTTAGTAASDSAPSGAGTSATAARTEGDRNSTFSSPAPSVRSMTTTLTTVQSVAPTLNTTTPATQAQPGAHHLPQLPTAVPTHLAPHSLPVTYHSATANNALTDDASILTLASSSKRRRRNSLDTNASVRALAPQSVFGGSRESLPLSVLSGTVIHPGQADNASIRDPGYSIYNPGSKLNTERASLISASGVNAPALTSERNSYIGSKYGDAASVRSGLLGGMHGRNDSVSGSIGGREHTTRTSETTAVTTPTAATAPAATGPPSTTPISTNTVTEDISNPSGQLAGAIKPEKPKVDRKSSDLGES